MSKISFPLQTDSKADFSGGLNTRDNPPTLKPNETPYILNYQIIKNGYGLASRAGMDLLVTLPGNKPIQGLWPFNALNQPEVLLAVSNGILYSINPNTKTYTQLLTGLSTTLLFDGHALADDFYITNHIDGLIHIAYDGSYNIVVNTVANAPFCDILCDDGHSRLYAAGDPNMPNRVYFSSFGNGTDWQTVNNAGYFDIKANGHSDGDIINTLCHSGDYTYAGRNNGTVKISGTDPFTMNVDDVQADFGMIGQQACKVKDNYMFFLTKQHGVCSMDFFYPRTRSNRVEPTFMNFNISKFSGACAVQDGYTYRIALPKAGSAYNNCQMVYDTLLDAWTYYEGQNIAYFASSMSTNTIWGGDSVNSNVYVMNSGNTDNGAAIALDFYSNQANEGDSTRPKIPVWMIVYTQNGGSEQITAAYALDFGAFTNVSLVPSPGTRNVWSTVLGTGLLQWGNSQSNANDLFSANGLLQSKGNLHGKCRYFQARFYSSGVTTQINIIGWDFAFVPLLPN